MIEVGEYVRTKRGYIAKLEYTDIQPNKKYYFFDETIYYDWGEAIDFLEEEEIERYIKTHSKNIINLIEVGDYVNGYKVDDIENGKLIIGDTTQVVEQIVENNEIKNIVTKEQFNSVMYKVGDIE